MARRELERRIHDLQGRLNRRAVPSAAGGPEFSAEEIAEVYRILYQLGPDVVRRVLVEGGLSEAEVQRALDALRDG
jgi:hypothetical protein